MIGVLCRVALGDGCCRSTTLSGFTDKPQDIAQAAKTLLRALNVPHERIRGIGLTVSGPQHARLLTEL